MLQASQAGNRSQHPQPKFFTRRLGDLIGHDHSALDYVRPASWRDTIKGDVAKRRWQDWTAQLEHGDSVFHGMPEGMEDEWCAILDWLRWDYLRIVHRSTAPEPRMGAFHRLPRDARDAAIKAAHAMWMRWGMMRGRPWAIIRDARNRAFACHHIDFYRWRAGEPVIYTAPRRNPFAEAGVRPMTLQELRAPPLHSLKLKPLRARRRI